MIKVFSWSRAAVVGLWALILLLGVVRLLPVHRFGDAAFGYDTGIYRRLAFEYFVHAHDPAQPPFAFAVFSNTVQAIGFSLDTVTVGLYVALHLGILAALYALAERWWGRNTAVVALLIALTSLTQWQFYWWYYYREAIAWLCLLIGWHLLEKKSPWILVPLCIAGSLHPFSLLPWFATVAILAVIKKDQRMFLLLSHGIAGIVIVLLNRREFTPYWELFINAKGLTTQVPSYRADELSGQFIDISFFIRAAFLYLPFAVVGVWQWGRKQLVLSIFLLVNLFLYSCHIILYRRLLIFVDSACILFAAVGMLWVWEHIKDIRWGRMLLAVYMIMAGLYWFVSVYVSAPLIDPTELVEIEQLQTVSPTTPVIVLTSQIAPWVYGFAPQPVIAPGMFEYNQWTEGEWQVFWHGTDIHMRHALMERYSTSTLYLYIPRSDREVWQKRLINDPAVDSIDEGVWQYTAPSTR